MLVDEWDFTIAGLSFIIIALFALIAKNIFNDF